MNFFIILCMPQTFSKRFIRQNQYQCMMHILEFLQLGLVL